jgi:uncharacterized protein YjbJ (UPF0337 family)
MGDGTKDRAVGRVKEAAGDLTGNKDLEHEGKADQALGNVKDKVGNIADKAKDVAEDVADKVKDVVHRD